MQGLRVISLSLTLSLSLPPSSHFPSLPLSPPLYYLFLKLPFLWIIYGVFIFLRFPSSAMTVLRSVSPGSLFIVFLWMISTLFRETLMSSQHIYLPDHRRDFKSKMK